VHDTIKQVLTIRKKGCAEYTESDYAESFISLVAAPGSCLDGFGWLKSGRGIRELGLSILSSDSARLFLYAFHEGELFKGRPRKEP